VVWGFESFFKRSRRSIGLVCGSSGGWMCVAFERLDGSRDGRLSLA
jgi:hypothetical protein